MPDSGFASIAGNTLDGIRVREITLVVHAQSIVMADTSTVEFMQR
jgi:hypothetical protein